MLSSFVPFDHEKVREDIPTFVASRFLTTSSNSKSENETSRVLLDQLKCARPPGFRVKPLENCVCTSCRQCLAVGFPTQSGQENDEDEAAVDDQDYLNEDELAELQRDEENIKKEVRDNRHTSRLA